jgi:RNA 2',3'-cyclic 3'-phosphodiesterase
MPDELFESPQRTNRLLLVAYLDVEPRARATELRQELLHRHALSGTPVPAQILHVTLLHLDDHAELPSSLVADAIAVGAKVNMPPFEVTFDRVVSLSRQGKMPLALCGGEGVAGLMAFQQALRVAMTKGGLGRYVKRKKFNPHVTLFYDRRHIDEPVIEPIRWTVREFALVHSLLGQTRHIRLASWPLRG